MMIDRPFIAKLLCVALVAAVMLPVGRMLFPYLSADMTEIQFHALEAIASAALGFGLYGILG
ncbi:MAG TPA: hypothetical protein VFB31_06245 [Pseudolabrys sp.]|nr:hypothetical protein [Pseudolabrys sp.]